MKPRIASSIGALTALSSFCLAGCERVILVDPAPRSASIALSLLADNVAGGPAQAFDKADALWIQVRSSTEVRVERTIPIQSGGRDVPVALEVPLGRTTESFTVNAEVRLGTAVLFRGSATLQLQVGNSQVALPLTPVGQALVLPASIPTLTAYGDSVRVSGAIVFATLDTVSVTPVTTWTSLDPTVVAVVGTVPVARADGDARLIGQVTGLTDTLTVRVLAEVQTITIQPDAGILPQGTTRQFSAQLFDRRNNRLTRPVVWSSTNPQVLGIDQNGLATGLATGSAQVRATSGNASSSLTVQVRAVGPGVVTNPATAVSPASAVLNASIQPNGLATDAWFLIGPEPTLVEAQTTPIIAVPPGSSPVAITTQVSLAPRTTYYARAYARSAGGTTTGNVISFSTPAPPFAVTTGAATNLTPTRATLNGTVSTDTLPASMWFEWGTDSLFTQFASTPVTPVPPLTTTSPISAIADDLRTLQPYFFRAAARNASGTIYGAVSRFMTAPAPQQTSPAPAGRSRRR
ncbi:MAG: Ig-like domain-containing protein [Longimicrobiales bacterium]